MLSVGVTPSLALAIKLEEAMTPSPSKQVAAIFDTSTTPAFNLTPYSLGAIVFR